MYSIVLLIVFKVELYAYCIRRFDTWSTYLYTRGGPYWQVAKIPFASFIFQVRGSIQDRQQSPPLHEVQRWSVVLKDRVDGPFALEIDYMGAMFDAFHDRTLRWEMYPFNRL